MMKFNVPGCVSVQPIYPTVIVNYSGQRFNLEILSDTIEISPEPVVFDSYEDLVKLYPEQTDTLIVVTEKCHTDVMKNDNMRTDTIPVSISRYHTCVC